MAAMLMLIQNGPNIDLLYRSEMSCCAIKNQTRH